MSLADVRIEDVVNPLKGSLVSGPFGSNISSKYFVPEGIPVIRGNNLSLGRDKFIDKGYVYITEQKAHELRNCIALAGDIIFTAAGTLGQVGIIPKNTRFPYYIISNKQIRLRLNLDNCYPLFIYYYLSSPPLRAYLISQNKGSSVPLLTLGIIRKVPMKLPCINGQKKIAAILSAYDDLIENNKRRIALLEQMAEEIYREWFVRFRFPGYQTHPFEKGIPKGWAEVRLDEFCEKVTDGTHDTPKPVESGHFLVTGKNIKNYQVDFSSAYLISKNDHKEISKRSGLKEGDILYSNIGTIGQTAIVSANPDYSVKNVIIFRVPDRGSANPSPLGDG